MPHYLTYHSAENMGFSFREPDDASLPQAFSIVTTKKLRDAEGSIVWVVSGEGKPRDYRLESWFRGERFASPEESEPYEASGPGVAFRPDGIRLNKLAWFPELMKAMAHFSLGTQRLSDEQVDWFIEAARAGGFVVPGPGGEVDTGPAPLLKASPGPAPRTIVEVNRLVRDSAVSLTVKILHGCRCQVCGVALEAPDGLYAEGAHIRPLGAPHHGADVIGNILCLCPNHHVLFDKGAFGIGDDLDLLQLEGRLRTVADHRIDLANLGYHREIWKLG